MTNSQQRRWRKLFRSPLCLVHDEIRIVTHWSNLLQVQIMLNRSIGILKPKAPFYEWLESLPDPTKIDPSEYEEHTSIFLLPTYEMLDDREEIKKQFFDLMFERALHDWWLDESDWPKTRDLKAFHEWFDLQILDGISDLVDAPLIEDEVEELDA